jgi:hypothetical protein
MLEGLEVKPVRACAVLDVGLGLERCIDQGATGVSQATVQSRSSPKAPWVRQIEILCALSSSPPRAAGELRPVLMSVRR